MRHACLLTLMAIFGFGLFVFSPRPSLRGQLAMAEQERKVILVAARNLQVGTTFHDDNVRKLTKKKLIAAIDVPPDAIQTEEELLDRMMRCELKADGHFTNPNLVKIQARDHRDDLHLYTVKLPYEAIGPWVTAGKRINVTCTYRDPVSQIVRHINLLSDLLVAEVTDPDSSKSSYGTCRSIFNRVTLKCSLEDAHWLQTAQVAGGQMRFLIIGERSEPFPVPSAEERYAFFNVVNHGD